MSDFPSQEDPGLDRHVWESEWESLQEELADRPAETLPALVDIVAEMLRGEGHAIDDDPVASAGEEREVLDDFREARRISRIVAGGGDVDPGDVGAAIESITAVYQTLIENAD